MGEVIFTQVEDDLRVCSIVGQQFFGRQGRYTSYDALAVGLEEVGDVGRKWELDILMPIIGCGLGGGDWNVVKALERSFDVTLWYRPEDKQL